MRNAFGRGLRVVNNINEPRLRTFEVTLLKYGLEGTDEETSGLSPSGALEGTPAGPAATSGRDYPNGVLVFSKLKLNRFPFDGELEKIVKAVLLENSDNPQSIVDGLVSHATTQPIICTLAPDSMDAFDETYRRMSVSGPGGGAADFGWGGGNVGNSDDGAGCDEVKDTSTSMA